MDMNFKIYDSGNKKMRIGFKKPWWNDNLKHLFQEACKAEKEYTRCRKSGGNASIMHHVFVNKHKQFDRQYRKEKRKCLSGYQAKLGELKTNDPKKFWNEISNLGPKSKKSRIQKEVILHDGKITTDIGKILQKWEKHYRELLASNTAENSESGDFVNRVKETLNIWNKDYISLLTSMNITSGDSNRGYIAIVNLNRDTTNLEVEKALKLSKNGKAVGIDNLPNDILKCLHVKDVLHSLFNKCFQYGIVPNILSQTLVCPIVKPGKDPRISYKLSWNISNIYCIKAVFHYS